MTTTSTSNNRANFSAQVTKRREKGGNFTKNRENNFGREEFNTTRDKECNNIQQLTIFSGINMFS